MTRSLFFITHPDVVIDPAVPVAEWPLSARGLERMRCMAKQPWLPRLSALYCSTERKARDGAAVLSDLMGLTPIERADLGENDRTATGYLVEAEFQAVVERFFAEPDSQILGWASAVTEQKRIVAALDAVIQDAPADGDIAVVAHGAVGALSLAHYLGEPISRRFDQLGRTGGHYYRLTLTDRRIVHGWQPIDG